MNDANIQIKCMSECGYFTLFYISVNHDQIKGSDCDQYIDCKWNVRVEATMSLQYYAT